MTTQTVTIPCTFTFSHSLAEPETATEPRVEEEFLLEKFFLGDIDLLQGKLSMLDAGVENALYKYLKEQNEY